MRTLMITRMMRVVFVIPDTKNDENCGDENDYRVTMIMIID